MFSTPISVSKSTAYRLTFDYLGKRGSGGGIVGIAIGTPSNHRWLAVTQQKGLGESNPLIDDGKWHTYSIKFIPGGKPWFTPDGSRAVQLPTIHSIRIMREDSWGTPGDAYFDNFALRPAPRTRH